MGLALVVKSSEPDPLGLFGYTEDAVIQNLRLEDVSTRNEGPVGMIVGRNPSGVTWNLQIPGQMASDRCGGGAVSTNAGGTVQNAETRGTIQNLAFAFGDLIGINVDRGAIRFSKSSVALSGVEDRAAMARPHPERS